MTAVDVGTASLMRLLHWRRCGRSATHKHAGFTVVVLYFYVFTSVGGIMFPTWPSIRPFICRVYTTSQNTGNLLEFDIPSGNTGISWNLIAPPGTFCATVRRSIIDESDIQSYSLAAVQLLELASLTKFINLRLMLATFTEYRTGSLWD